MLQRPSVDHHLRGSVRNGVQSGSERYSWTGPRRFEMWHVLDADGDPGEGLWALSADPVDRGLHRVVEEVRLAGRSWR